jgi:hypothetical protein
MRVRRVFARMDLALVAAGCGSTSSQRRGQAGQVAANPQIKAARRLTACYPSSTSKTTPPKLSETTPKQCRIQSSPA